MLIHLQTNTKHPVQSALENRESQTQSQSDVNLVSVSVSDGRHQLIFDAAGAVLTLAVEVILLLEQLLAVFGDVEEVHVADGQLFSFRDLPQSPQLDPASFPESQRERSHTKIHLQCTACVSKTQITLKSYFCHSHGAP